jgi:hypothetical protein
MERRQPTPLCRTFTVCKQIFIDEITQEYTLVAPLHQIFLPHYPATMDLSVFARWTNAHGPYRVELQLRTLDGEVVWRDRMQNPFEAPGPLAIAPITLRHRFVSFPAPGKYEVVLLANEEEVAMDVILAHLHDPAN